MRKDGQDNGTGIFQHPVWVSILALTAAIVWGWAYPLIKMGFEEFRIGPSMTGSKMLFAGIRFTVSGIIILAAAKIAGRSFHIKPQAAGHEKESHRVWDVAAFVLIFSLLNTTLHYTFFYIGLSYSQGARAAILNSMSVFTVVILACIFFKSDRMTLRKALGVIIGITGILTLNGDALVGETSHYRPGEMLGDLMIILNALCSAFASLMTRGLARRTDVFVGTGYSLAIGGILTIVPGIMMGGTLPRITPWGMTILMLLVAISTIGFTLYNRLLATNPVGRIAIYNSLIPVVGAVSSCWCLGEPFYRKYVIAGTLAATGIYLINKGQTDKSGK